MKAWRDPLVRAWAALVLLSGASTLLSHQRGGWAVAAILLFAGIKARLVLVRYLGLERVPAVRVAFDLLLAVLVGMMGLLLALE